MRIVQHCVAAVLLLGISPWVVAQAPIKVGTIFPLSGGSGPVGQHITEGISAMAALINADGGVMGRPIEIIARDDESTPAVGVSRAAEMASLGVDVVIEGLGSPVTLAMQPVLARANILDITLASKADAILSGEGNPLAIRMNSSNAQDGVAIARYIAQTAKAQRVAFLTENDAYGNGARDAIEKELRALGHAYEKVAEEKFPFTQADFRVALTNIRVAKPDVTVAINANEGLGMPAIIRQFRQGRVPGQLVAAVGTIVPSMLAVAGSAANGIVSADMFAPDAEQFTSGRMNQRFIAKTQEMFSITPDKSMTLAATALQVWAMAANDVQSLDRHTLAKRIRGGRFPGTLLGDLSFAPDGQANIQLYPFTVRDGKIVFD